MSKNNVNKLLLERETKIITQFSDIFLRIKRIDEDFDYASAEKEFNDKGYHEHDMMVDELGELAQGAISNIGGEWKINRVGDHFIITNTKIPNKEMEIGLSVDKPMYKDQAYKYYYELRGVNRNVSPEMSGHQGNYTISKTRFNNPAHLFISGKYPFELWFN